MLACGKLPSGARLRSALPLALLAIWGCSASNSPGSSGDDGGMAAGGAPVAGSGPSGGLPGTGGTAGSAAGAAPTAGSGTGGSAGGGSGSMLKGAIARGDKCVFEFGDLFFQVEVGIAGRVTSARLGAVELLSGPSASATNYGSTFWTSPQADWNWPPIPEIDNRPFMPSATDISCTLVGTKVNSATHPVVHDVSIAKKFTADLAKSAMIVEYTIKNEGTAAKRLAPWEITRVGPDGLTFYAADSAPTGTVLPPITNAGGAIWFKYDATVANNAKLFGDGKGWIAHVTPQNLLLVKVFQDIPPTAAAPNEAEIEVYAANPAGQPAGRYVEVENQGAYADIAPGASVAWTVRWYLRMLPPTVAARPGNAALLDFVQQTIQ